MGPEDTIRRFFDAISTGDAEATAALADPSIVILIGGNELVGIEALQAMAGQRPEGLDSTVEVLGIEGANGHYDVSARRVQHWTETGEVALDQEFGIVIDLNDEGLVTRAEMHPKTD